MCVTAWLAVYNDSQKQKKINELLFFVGSKIVIASFRLLVEKCH